MNLKTPTTKTIDGTSFHDSIIVATVKQLKKILGKPDFEWNTGDDKSNFEWIRETKNGIVFCVYDWKEYRKLRMNEVIEWHIGGYSKSDTEIAKLEIEIALCS